MRYRGTGILLLPTTRLVFGLRGIHNRVIGGLVVIIITCLVGITTGLGVVVTVFRVRWDGGGICSGGLGVIEGGRGLGGLVFWVFKVARIKFAVDERRVLSLQELGGPRMGEREGIEC